MEQLEKVINSYDKVFLLTKDVNSVWKESFMEHAKGKEGVLVLLSDVPEQGWKDVCYIELSPEEEYRMTSIFRTYECSNNFRVITGKTAPYPSVLNLITHGILTEAQALEALFL